MDAVVFFKERQRMCDSFERCAVCPLYVSSGCNMPSDEKDIDKLIKTVEKWSKEHPRKTNKEAYDETFKKLFPGMSYWKCSGVMPFVLCKYFGDKGGCPECKKFWSSEYKENRDEEE